MQEAEDKMIAEIFKLTKKMMLIMKKALKCDYIQESVVGNEVPHFHIHLIPRYFKNGFNPLPRKEFNLEEAEKALKKIIKAI
jgi:histidine triad (HIT) family protein